MMNNQLLESAEDVIKRIDGDIPRYLGDLILTNTKTKKQLIIKNPIEPIISLEPIISVEPIEPIKPIISLEPIKPKKPIEFLDLPIDVRNIIKGFTFNYDRKYFYNYNDDIKKIFKNQITNIDNMILLKKMFGEFPKEIIFNGNRFYREHWNSMNLPRRFKNHFIRILNNSNLLKNYLEYSNINIYLHARLYNDLNFDMFLWTSPKFAYNKDMLPTRRLFYLYIDKQGYIYDKYNNIDFDINDKRGSLKYKDMHNLIKYVKTTLYNS